MGRSHTANSLIPRRFADARLVGEGAEGGVILAKDRHRGGRRVALKWIPQDRLVATRRMFRLVEAAASPHLAPLLELLPAEAGGPVTLEPAAPDDAQRVPTRGRPNPPQRSSPEAALGAPNTASADGGLVAPAPLGAWLVLGWVEGVALPRGPATWSTVAPRLLGLARALEALHALGVFHGDISPANVVLTPTGATVLVDFGAVGTHGIGTPGFLAPEVALGGGGQAADTWSLAAVGCWCWLGDVPARDVTRLGSRRDVERRLRVLLDAAEHGHDAGDRAALRLLTAMLDPDPSGRPTMPGVVDALATWASGDASAAASRDFVVWSRPAADPAAWPWIGDELDEVVEAARRGVPLVHVDGDEDDGASSLLQASITTLARLGANVERVQAHPVGALLERWLEAPEGTVLVAVPDPRRRLASPPDPSTTSSAAAATEDASETTPLAGVGEAVTVGLAEPIGRGSGTDGLTWQPLRRGVGVARATLIVSGLSPLAEVDPDTTADDATTFVAGALQDDGDATESRRRSIRRVALRPRTDPELLQLLASVGVRRRVRPWLEALRVLSGGAAGRARRVVSVWIDRQSQAPDAHDVARLVARGEAPLSPVEVERVLDVAWGLDEAPLPEHLGNGRMPHDVVLAAARSSLATRERGCPRSPRALAAFEELAARASLLTPSLALDLRPRARASASSTSDRGLVEARALDLDDPATQVVLSSLCALDDDGVFDPRVPVSAGEAAAFDELAMHCLVRAWAGRESQIPRRSLARFVSACVALARRRLLAGAAADALLACVVATQALVDDGSPTSYRDDALVIALTIEHARALQRLGRASEAGDRLAPIAARLVEEARGLTVEEGLVPGATSSDVARVSTWNALLRVAALEARLAVDRGDAATLYSSPTPLRVAAEAIVATVHTADEVRTKVETMPARRAMTSSEATEARHRLAWPRACFEYATWSTLLALHAGDVATAWSRARALLATLDGSSETKRSMGAGRVARALHVAGNVAQVDGRLHDAAGLYARAATAFRESGEDDASALVLATAAGLAWPAGDVDAALSLGQAALRRTLARVATGGSRAGGGLWGMLANVAPALMHTDPGQLAAWIDALEHEGPSTPLESARRAVFRAQRGRLARLAAGEPLATLGTHARDDAAALIAAQARLVDCGARDEAIGFALDDVDFALRRGDLDAANEHFERAAAWAGAPLRDDVAALLVVASVEIFVRASAPADTRPHDDVARNPSTPDSSCGSSSRDGAHEATTPQVGDTPVVPRDFREVTSRLSSVAPAAVWAAREQRWIALQLRLALHRSLLVASERASAPNQFQRLSRALHTSQRELSKALEDVMTKTPPTDRPTLLRSLALADDEVGWLERLAEGEGAAGQHPSSRVDPEPAMTSTDESGPDAASSPTSAVAPTRSSGAVTQAHTQAHTRSATPPQTPHPRVASELSTTRPGDEETWRARGLAAYRRLAREDQLERVLAQFVDALMELTDAERGLVVLADDGARFEVARELHGDGAAVQVSRSVVERVLESGEPVLATDAVEDARFGRARSVSHLALRSILAVPLRHRGRVIGAAYVDHRLRRGAFDEASLAGVESFADLASLAIAHARAVALLQARSESLAAREVELAAALEARDVEVTALRHEAGQGAVLQLGTRALVGASEVMQRVFRLLRRVAASNVPVVIAGESGTGKELVARALHELGPRAKAPFIAENCAAIPESLLESALFGHARGAFTGAVQASPGLFEAANGGTLFLDEITETSLAMQSKLLRVLQEGEVRRIGETASRRVDVRIVVATNRDLERLVAEGKFRQDLYYRLSVVRVDVPSLRERVEDIPKLIAYFLQLAAGAAGEAPSLRVSSAAMRRLVAHRWPGNVRELENEVRRWLALVDDVVREDDLSPAILAATGGAPVRRELPPGEALVELLSDPAFIDADESEPEGTLDADGRRGRGEAAATLEDAALDLRTHVERVERALVGEALRRTGNNLTQAAKLLGLSRFGLQKKLRRRDDTREPTLGGEHALRPVRGRSGAEGEDGWSEGTS